MTKLVFLGTANAIPDIQHENTHFVLIDGFHLVMVDCANNALVRLSMAGLKILDLTDLILTHFHPDHVSGVPSLLMNSWLLGRTHPLRIHGLAHTLDRLRNMMELYDWKTWPGFFPVEFNPIPEREMAVVFEESNLRVFASPVRHLIPTIGLRIEVIATGKVLAYSCDTEPCPETVRLAHRADFLVHEATGEAQGHSSASQAAEIAQEAGVKSLYLIHYPSGDFDAQALVDAAQQKYPYPVHLARDFLELNL